MANIITGQSFSAGDQVTSAKLNNIIGSAKLDSDSITGTTLNLTNGELKVATNGITDNELNANSVTTAKIANDAVTYDKIQDVAASSVIGNTTGSTATPTNVSILDEDTMASNSATALATQQSIKAYVDSQVGGWNFTNQTVSSSLSPPNTFTDLDLSSFVGANSAYVIFEASGNTGGYTLNLNFRKKGSTYDVASGIDKKITGSGIGYQLFGITDSSGVIQYRQSDVTGTGTITLKIIGYVK